MACPAAVVQSDSCFYPCSLGLCHYSVRYALAARNYDASGSESIGTNLSGSGSGSSASGSPGASGANGAVSGSNNRVSSVHTALISSPTCHGTNCMGSPGSLTPLPSSSMTTVRGQSATSIPYISQATGTTTSPSDGSTATPLFNGATSSSGPSLIQLMSLAMTAFIALIVQCYE